jgi:hypothetical protein
LIGNGLSSNIIPTNNNNILADDDLPDIVAIVSKNICFD